MSQSWKFQPNVGWRHRKVGACLDEIRFQWKIWRNSNSMRVKKLTVVEISKENRSKKQSQSMTFSIKWKGLITFRWRKLKICQFDPNRRNFGFHLPVLELFYEKIRKRVCHSKWIFSSRLQIVVTGCTMCVCKRTNTFALTHFHTHLLSQCQSG